MKNKNYLIYVAIFLVIIVILFFAYFLQDGKQTADENGEQNVAPSNSIENIIVNDPELEALSIPGTFDIQKIVAPKELDESQVSILESPEFSIPKSIEGIEMMNKEEKEALGLDPELNIQVLGRNSSGQATGYQFIYSEEDFVLDLR